MMPSFTIIVKAGFLRLISRLWRKNARHLHDAILHLNDFNRVARDLQAGTGLGYVFEMLQYQTIERLGAVQRQVQSQLAIQLAQTAAAFQQETAVFVTQEFAGLRWSLRRELSDNLLEDILQRHQPEQFAVFIHHQSQARMALLKLLQLLEQRGVGRYEIRLVERIAQLRH